jgi:hypothetical protein
MTVWPFRKRKAVLRIGRGESVGSGFVANGGPRRDAASGTSLRVRQAPRRHFHLIGTSVANMVTST